MRKASLHGVRARGSAQLERGQGLAVAAIMLILACGCLPQLIRAAAELAIK